MHDFFNERTSTMPAVVDRITPCFPHFIRVYLIGCDDLTLIDVTAVCSSNLVMA